MTRRQRRGNQAVYSDRSAICETHVLTQNTTSNFTSQLPDVTKVTDAAKEAQGEIQEIAKDTVADAKDAVAQAETKINEITGSASKEATETTEAAKEEAKDVETKATDAAEEVKTEAKDAEAKVADKADEVAEDAKAKKPNAIKRLSLSFKKFVKNVTA